ncbi:unnamed protein product [Heligmosomoides polygyrus]|uniref:Uncharacterized protein n=1 Tax=Heligmosomoides polygyrus TaxID=6339 RepID=A0A3P8DV98_HELPZ|nr:unnamed protein product [Heligmosomoides polygyrus]
MNCFQIDRRPRLNMDAEILQLLHHINELALHRGELQNTRQNKGQDNLIGKLHHRIRMTEHSIISQMPFTLMLASDMQIIPASYPQASEKVTNHETLTTSSSPPDAHEELMRRHDAHEELSRHSNAHEELKTPPKS